MLNPDSIARVKTQLMLAVDDILNQGFHSSKGDDFDTAVANILLQWLNAVGSYVTEDGKKLKFELVSSEKFKTDYPEFKSACTKQCEAGVAAFKFNGLATPKHGAQADLLIVRQPNGSQSWPDLLLIANGVGLPFEIKSSKKDLVVWNGGLPRPGRVYIFNSYAVAGKGTTMFMGDAIINQEAVDKLLDFHEQQKKIADRINKDLAEIHRHEAEAAEIEANAFRPGVFQYYPRAMYVSKEKFFDNETLKTTREKQTKKFLQAFTFQPNLPLPTPNNIRARRTRPV